MSYKKIDVNELSLNPFKTIGKDWLLISAVKDGKINTKTNNEVGTVEFKNVSFKYPDADEYLLKDISFKANKGDTVAFIGSTGSGKSTLINLIPRFYDATERL